MRLGQTENLTFPDFASDPTATVPTVNYTFGGDMHAGYSPLPDPTLSYHDPVYDAPRDAQGNLYDPANWQGSLPTVSPPASAPATPNFWDSIVQAAKAAIEVRAAYQTSQHTRQPAPGSSTATATGMLITRNPLTGAVQTARPPVGVRYPLPDGRTMVNNGDGTFSLISGFGSEMRVSYSSAAADTNWLLYGALGLGALFLLRK
jgi:hypothetical protein